MEDLSCWHKNLPECFTYLNSNKLGTDKQEIIFITQKTRHSPKMAAPILPWLTKEALSSWLGREVTGVTMSAAVPPGNNYGSVVTRVTAKLGHRESELSLIVKSELTEGAIKENFTIPTNTEHDLYYKFLPEARKITETSFAPESFPIPRPESVLLEDLSVRGFKMADRRAQLDFEHCRLYVQAAAEFHSVSLAVHKKNPAVLEAICEEKLFNAKNNDTYKKMITGGLTCMANEAKKRERFQSTSRVIEEVRDHLLPMLVEAHLPRKDLNTINQGDAWLTNMMFRYDENGRVEEVKILDFQMLRFASPVNDLVMFIWSSANNDVKSSRLPELYNIYLKSFNENLRRFGCSEVLTEEVFTDQVRRLSPQALFVTACFLPLILNTDPIDAEKLFKEDIVKYYENYYDRNFCDNFLYQSMAQLEQAGVFDYLENYLKSSSK